MTETVILKLGGSVITDKSGECAIDHARLQRIAEEIALRSSVSLVIVHGAGSCGHPEARRYGLDKGLTGGNTCGVYETHAAVAMLNQSVVKALRSAGLEAVGVHPLAMALAEDGRLAACDTGHLRVMLDHGIIPVLHGDVVMDLRRGACIVSGDQLVSYLAEALSAARVGLATDVPGVLKDGAVIPRIDRTTADGIAIGASKSTDVTGGMKGKIAELLALAEKGTDSHIFHITRVGRFLDGADHGGTVVSRSR